MSEKKTTVAGVIRSLREGKGWTPYRLAQEAGLRQSNLARIEAGEQTLKLPTAQALTRALGVSLSVFDDAI